MPIVEYRIPAGHYPGEAVTTLLEKSCDLFAEVLECPLDRVRALAHEVSPHATCVGGTMVSEGGMAAPYFTFFLLDGRPEAVRHRLLAGFTDLLVECLGVDRSVVRGAVTIVAPTNWAIGGTPASIVRADEVAARKSDSVGP